MLSRLWTFMLLAAVTASARAQLRLPTLPVPGLSLQTLPQTLGGTADTAVDRLAAARQLAIGRLIRSSNRRVEADAGGNPIVRGEILALNPDGAVLDHARSIGFSVLREQDFAAAGLHTVVLNAPANLSTRKALELLRAADAGGTYDYNHIYTGSGAASDATALRLSQAAYPPSTPTAPASADVPQAHIRVGLVDGGVANSPAALHDSVMHVWGCGGKPLPSVHGTAVASLLLAHLDADLYAADVYCGLPTGGAVDAILGAFAWLAEERVTVINVSLVGPENALLEQGVARLIERGHLIVAAVGNDGPTAPPLYPAAYPQVVGVTGVDARRRVLLEAERGPQVMFAAPGADIKAVGLQGVLIDVRGTSFAAPAVAALLAAKVTAPDRSAAAAAVETLAGRAVDLGPPGRDFTYGFGFVAADAP